MLPSYGELKKYGLIDYEKAVSITNDYIQSLESRHLPGHSD